MFFDLSESFSRHDDFVQHTSRDNLTDSSTLAERHEGKSPAACEGNSSAAAPSSSATTVKQLFAQAVKDWGRACDEWDDFVFNRDREKKSGRASRNTASVTTSTTNISELSLPRRIAVKELAAFKKSSAVKKVPSTITVATEHHESNSPEAYQSQSEAFSRPNQEGRYHSAFLSKSTTAAATSTIASSTTASARARRVMERLVSSPPSSSSLPTRTTTIINSSGVGIGKYNSFLSPTPSSTIVAKSARNNTMTTQTHRMSFGARAPPQRATHDTTESSLPQQPQGEDRKSIPKKEDEVLRGCGQAPVAVVPSSSIQKSVNDGVLTASTTDVSGGVSHPRGNGPAIIVEEEERDTRSVKTCESKLNAEEGARGCLEEKGDSEGEPKTRGIPAGPDSIKSTGALSRGGAAFTQKTVTPENTVTKEKIAGANSQRREVISDDALRVCLTCLSPVPILGGRRYGGYVAAAPYVSQANEAFLRSDFSRALSLLEELEAKIVEEKDEKQHENEEEEEEEQEVEGNANEQPSGTLPIPCELLVNKGLCLYKMRAFGSCSALLRHQVLMMTGLKKRPHLLEAEKKRALYQQQQQGEEEEGKLNATGITLVIRSAILLLDLKAAQESLMLLRRLVNQCRQSGKEGKERVEEGGDHRLLCEGLEADLLSYRMILNDLVEYKSCIASKMYPSALKYVAAACETAGRRGRRPAGPSMGDTSDPAFLVSLELCRLECLAKVRPREAEEDVRSLLEIFPNEGALWTWRAALQVSEQEPMESISIATQHLLRALAALPPSSSSSLIRGGAAASHPSVGAGAGGDAELVYTKAKALLKALGIINRRVRSAEHLQAEGNWRGAYEAYLSIVNGECFKGEKEEEEKKHVKQSFDFARQSSFNKSDGGRGSARRESTAAGAAAAESTGTPLERAASSMFSRKNSGAAARSTSSYASKTDALASARQGVNTHPTPKPPQASNTPLSFPSSPQLNKGAASQASSNERSGPTACTTSPADTAVLASAFRQRLEKKVWSEVVEMLHSAAILSSIRVELLCCQLKSGDHKGVEVECSKLLAWLSQERSGEGGGGGTNSNTAFPTPPTTKRSANRRTAAAGGGGQPFYNFSEQLERPKTYRIRPAILLSFRAQAYLVLGDMPKALADARAVHAEAPSDGTREFIRFMEGCAEGEGGGPSAKGRSTRSGDSGGNGQSRASGALRDDAAKRNAYLQLLGVSSTVTAAELTKAFKLAALRWHPDKWMSSSEEERSAAEEHFKKLNEAYSSLQSSAAASSAL